MDDPHARLAKALRDAALDSPGELDPALRRAAADCGNLPQPLAAFVEKVRRHAYQITDDDVAALKAAGYSDDQIFEATVSAAVGASLFRLERGLAALAGEK
ncbi:MAG TPA: hypothetical protein VFF06_20360 [Polyangia bacterium]|nr:hypothetical protein [Polyangia bacterium]